MTPGRLLAVIFAGLMMLSTQSFAAGTDGAARERARACSGRWDELKTQHQDLQRLRGAWEREAQHCAGTGVYEYHLATLLEAAERFDEAIVLLRRSVDTKGMPLRDELYVTMLGIQFNKADIARPRDIAAATAANSALNEFLQKNPSFLPAMQISAAQRVKLKDYAGAESMAREALKSDPANSRANSALVIALAATKRCAEAKVLVRPTLEANSGLFGDFDFMMAAAYCYYDTGDVLTAEQVLAALQSRVPEVKDEPAFNRMAQLILREKAKPAP